jgi:type IV secretory pathway TrbF-like protein
LASSLGLTPATALSYARGRHGWSLHIARARAQQQAWRTTAFASFAVSALLALSLASTVLGSSVVAGMVASARAVETQNFADPPSQLFWRIETLDHPLDVVPVSLPLGRVRSLTREASHGED